MPSINSPTPDATTTTKGKLQLAGDLGGTATSPTVLQVSRVPYKFAAYQSVAQSIPNTYALTLVQLQTKEYDTGTNFSTSTYLFTAPVAGFYRFEWSVGIPVTNNGIAYSAIYKNGTVFKHGNTLAQSTGGTQNSYSTGAATLSLAQNDTVGLYIANSSTVAQNTVATAIATYFMGTLVSLT